MQKNKAKNIGHSVEKQKDHCFANAAVGCENTILFQKILDCNSTSHLCCLALFSVALCVQLI